MCIKELPKPVPDPERLQGHLFQIFRLRFGDPKGRQAMNEEEVGDFCQALQEVIPVDKIILLYEDHEQHAFKQFVITRMVAGPDSGGVIIQALRQAWIMKDTEAAVSALESAFEYLKAETPDFNTTGQEGYHASDEDPQAHEYIYHDPNEIAPNQVKDGIVVPGLLNRAYPEPKANQTPLSMAELFLLTGDDMVDEEDEEDTATEIGSNDGLTEKGSDDGDADDFKSMFGSVDGGVDKGAKVKVENGETTDDGVIIPFAPSAYSASHPSASERGHASGTETDLESVVFVSGESDFGDISDFDSAFGTDMLSEGMRSPGMSPFVSPTMSPMMGPMMGPSRAGGEMMSLDATILLSRPKAASGKGTKEEREGTSSDFEKVDDPKDLSDTEAYDMLSPEFEPAVPAGPVDDLEASVLLDRSTSTTSQLASAASIDNILAGLKVSDALGDGGPADSAADSSAKPAETGAPALADPKDSELSDAESVVVVHKLVKDDNAGSGSDEFVHLSSDGDYDKFDSDDFETDDEDLNTKLSKVSLKKRGSVDTIRKA